MTTITLRRIAAGLLIVTATTVTACTPAEVVNVAQHFGIDLSAEDAGELAAHYDAHPAEGRVLMDRMSAADCQGNVPCIIRVIFPDHAEQDALRVADCESKFNPSAKNPSSSARGVFQIIRSTWNAYAEPGMSITDPIDNTLTAKKIWASDGGSFSQWECR